MSTISRNLNISDKVRSVAETESLLREKALTHFKVPDELKIPEINVSCAIIMIYLHHELCVHVTPTFRFDLASGSCMLIRQSHTDTRLMLSTEISQAPLWDI